MSERYDVDRLLVDARSRIRRLSPHELQLAMTDGSVVIDTRSAEDRATEGTIPGSIPVALSVLLWRVDPASSTSDARLRDLHGPKVIVCNDGYSSSWAAATMADLGFSDVGDLEGGFRAWAAARLPVVVG